MPTLPGAGQFHRPDHIHFPTFVMSTDGSPASPDAVESLLAEVKALRDGTEELLILLSHIWQQRDDLRFKLSTIFTGCGREVVEETLACYECDTESPPSLAQALVDGWIDLQLAAAADVGVNFAGWCPACQRLHEETERELNAKSTDAQSDNESPSAVAMPGVPASGERVTGNAPLEPTTTDSPRQGDSIDEEQAAGSSLTYAASPPSSKAWPPPPSEHYRSTTPLYLRIYAQRHMTDIVRAVGHQSLSQDDFQQRMQSLVERYGPATIDPAVEELLESESQDGMTVFRLRGDVRQHARGLLGPPPELAPHSVAGEAATNAAPTGSQTAKTHPFIVPKMDLSTLKPVKLPRNKVLPEFEEHLKSRGIAFERIDEHTRRKYTDKYLGALDFIIREEGEPPELVTVRKSVTATQAHDLAQWKAIIGNQAFVSMIWPYVDDAGRQSWETTELCPDPLSEVGRTTDDSTIATSPDSTH